MRRSTFSLVILSSAFLSAALHPPVRGETAAQAKKVSAAFTLTVTVDPPGAGSMAVNPDQASYESGTGVWLTATPNPGWTFKKWTGDLDGSANPALITMNSNRTVVAHFGHRLFYMWKHPPNGGWVTVDPSAFNGIDNEYIYDHNQAVTLTANPDWQFEFLEWEGDAEINGVSTDRVTLTMNGDKTLIAVFGHHCYVYAVSSDGTLPALGAAWASPYKYRYAHGESVHLTAFPYTGRAFAGWAPGCNEYRMDRITDTRTDFDLILNTNQEWTAIFYDPSLAYDAVIATDPAGLDVMVDGSRYQSPKNCIWNKLSVHSIEADERIYPASGGVKHEFLRWSDSGAREHSVTATSAGTYTAFFDTQYWFTIRSDYGNPNQGGWFPPGTLADYEVQTPDTTEPGVRHRFIHWVGSGKLSFTDPKPSSVILIDRCYSVTAAWKTQFLTSISVGSSGGGAVLKDTLNTVTNLIAGADTLSRTGILAWHDSSAVIRIRAIPDSGYWFAGWEGDAVGTDTVITITVDSVMAVTAKFSPVGTVASPDFDPPAGTYASAQNVTITCATPGAVIHFTKNGNEPVESDSVYTKPVVVQSTMTLKAKAFLTGWNPGYAAAAAYIIATAVEDHEISDKIPSDFVLEQNYPNPFNPATSIRYELPEASRVRLCVYAVHGALIRTLLDGGAAPGVYHAAWNGTDDDGNPVPAGIYLFKMTAGTHERILKMTLIK